MKNLLKGLFCLLLVNCASNQETTSQKSYPTTGTIERLSPEINALIAKDAKIEIVADGFTWTEGPVWVKDKNYLLFSDIPPNRIFKWSEKEGKSLFLTPSGYTGETERKGEPGSNGLLFNAQKELVLCQHGDRRIAKMTSSLDDPKPQFETVIGKYQGKRFNSPNDAIYDSQGNLYFTDPPYGLEKNMEDPAKEIDFQGVYRFSNSGVLSLISKEVTRPNGIALSPDEKTLYVASSDPKKAVWMAYDLVSGQVKSERIFYDATGTKEKGLPDGMKVDKKGNIWATGPGGVWIFDASGKVLGKIKTGEATSNCAFDTEEKTIYMTCDDYLMRVILK